MVNIYMAMTEAEDHSMDVHAHMLEGKPVVVMVGDEPLEMVVAHRHSCGNAVTYTLNEVEG